MFFFIFGYIRRSIGFGIPTAPVLLPFIQRQGSFFLHINFKSEPTVTEIQACFCFQINLFWTNILYYYKVSKLYCDQIRCLYLATVTLSILTLLHRQNLNTYVQATKIINIFLTHIRFLYLQPKLKPKDIFLSKDVLKNSPHTNVVQKDNFRDFKSYSVFFFKYLHVTY